MKKTRTFFAWALVGAFWGTAPAYAQVPALIPVQGFITDDQGQALVGQRTLVFSLYADQAAGSALYTESFAINTPTGAFSVQLGSSQALDLSIIPEDGELWLGLSVDGAAELTPRLRFGAAPYAARAAEAREAARLQGRTPDDFAPADHTHPFSDITGVPADLGDGDDDTLGGLSCAEGQRPNFSGGAWNCAPDADVLGGLSCANGQVATFSGGAWQCATFTFANLPGVPAELADGDADTLGALTCMEGQQLVRSAGAWVCAPGPVDALAGADVYVENTGDTIDGDLVVSSLTDSDGATQASLTVEDAMFSDQLYVDSDEIDTTSVLGLSINTNSGAETYVGSNLVFGTANSSDDERTTLTRIVARLTNTNAAIEVDDALISSYCADFDGCKIIVVETGFDSTNLDLRRAAGPVLMMYESIGPWSVGDGTLFGDQDGSTREFIADTGGCVFADDITTSGGTLFEFGLINFTASDCTISIED